VANEDFILDHDPGADKGMTGDFAASTDLRTALDLDKSADTGLATDRTAVEINEWGNSYVVAQLNIVTDTSLV